MSRTVAIIQARLGSTRLPRKALADIGGRPMIAHVVERVRQTNGVDEVVVAVPSHADGIELWPAVEHVGDVAMFWGDGSVAENDVLGRYYQCAKAYRADVVLRVTADCPLWDPRLGEQVLQLLSNQGVDYASNIALGYRDGEDSEAFSMYALGQAYANAVAASDREHVTPFIRRNFVSATLWPAEDRSDVKTSVDTLEDLERVRAMVANQ